MTFMWILSAVVGSGLVAWARRCRHADAVREHHEDGWVWKCYRCGRKREINPKDRPAPIAVGEYSHAKAVAGKKRAELAAERRQAVEAGRVVETPTLVRPAAFKRERR